MIFALLTEVLCYFILKFFVVAATASVTVRCCCCFFWFCDGRAEEMSDIESEMYTITSLYSLRSTIVLWRVSVDVSVVYVIASVSAYILQQRIICLILFHIMHYDNGVLGMCVCVRVWHLVCEYFMCVTYFHKQKNCIDSAQWHLTARVKYFCDVNIACIQWDLITNVFKLHILLIGFSFEVTQMHSRIDFLFPPYNALISSISSSLCVSLTNHFLYRMYAFL